MFIFWKQLSYIAKLLGDFGPIINLYLCFFTEILYIHQLFHVRNRTAFCKKPLLRNRAMKKQKKPKPFFPPAQETHILQLLGCQQKNSGKIYFPIGRAMGFFQDPWFIQCLSQEVFTLHHCLYVCKTGMQITWKPRTHWDRQLWLYWVFVHNCGCVSIHYPYFCLCSQYLPLNSVFLLLHIHTCAEFFLHFICMLYYNVVCVQEEGAERIYSQCFSTPFQRYDTNLCNNGNSTV